MRYLLLGCRGTDSMNAQTEPGPEDAADKEGWTTFKSEASG
jgi:hypothetical protein